MRRALVAFILVVTVEARAQYILGDEAWAMGTDQGFFRPPVTGPALPTPTFDLVAGTTTPNDLSDSLTVNSTSMTLTASCMPTDLSGTDLVCRTSSGTVTFAETGTGASPAFTTQTPAHAFDAAEGAIRYDSSGKRHATASNTTLWANGDDVVIEVLVKQGTANNRAILGTQTSTTSAGVAITTTVSAATLRVSDGTTQASAAQTQFSSGGFFHALAFIDDDTNVGICVNGQACTTSTTITSVGDWTGPVAETAIGTFAQGSTTFGSDIVAVRVWTCSACLAGATNATEFASLARSRMATAFGVSPTIAAGDPSPTTLTRATDGMIDVVDGNVRHLYLASRAVPRVARRTYSSGTAVAGYLSEPAVSNIALQSQTLGTTWTAITVGDNVLANTFAGADLTTTGDDVDGNNSSAVHGLRQNITVTATSYTFSAWARAGSQSWVALRNNTIANGAAWFDLTTCTSSSCVVGEDCASAIGTTQAGVSRASAERYPLDTDGDGTADENLCRVSITYTGTAASHAHDLLCAPSDGNLTYTDADTAADCGFWGVRVEAYPTATSYLATTTASVARNADDVRFDGASHYTGSPSTMDVKLLCPNYNVGASGIAFSAGTNTNNVASIGVDVGDGARSSGVETGAVQWTITGSTDIADGVLHSVRQTLETDNVEAFSDGVSIGTDTLAVIPSATSSFVYVGSSAGAAGTPACLVTRARLWSSLVTPAVVP